MPAPTALAWQAYQDAYTARYRVAPIRNAKVNSCLKRFVQAVGADDAPDILRFYVGHSDTAYVRAVHALPLAVSDAEGLCAQYRMGREVTRQEVYEHARTQQHGAFNQAERILRTP